MTSRARARIVGIGMACPVGLRWRPALAAIQAGVTRFVDLDDGTWGQPRRASVLSVVDPHLTRSERAVALAHHALEEALTGVGPRHGRALPCYLALPEPGTGAPIDLPAFTQALILGVGASGLVPPIRIMGHHAGGRAAVFQALADALAALASGREELVLVGGADSLVDRVTIDHLVHTNRILGDTNRDGIIAGEGAGFLLLGHPETVPQHATLAEVVAVAVGHEELPFGGGRERISPAGGLSAVLHALRGEFVGRVDEVFAGTTGEAFYGREFSHAYLRNASLMPEPLRIEPVSNALGDLGAAAGAISVVRAVARLGHLGVLRLRTPNQSGLAYASSDGGLVGGCVVVRPR